MKKMKMTNTENFGDICSNAGRQLGCLFAGLGSFVMTAIGVSGFFASDISYGGLFAAIPLFLLALLWSKPRESVGWLVMTLAPLALIASSVGIFAYVYGNLSL